MPAIGVNVKNGFMLNFAFGGLSYSTTKYEDASSTSSILDFTFGKQMSIGISKNIGGHKEGGSKAHSHHMDDDDTAPKAKTKKADDDE